MSIAEPITRRWSRLEYSRMAEIGFFLGQRVELIDGEVLQMAAHGIAHANGVELATQAMFAAFGKTHRVRIQLPLDLGEFDNPEPDVAVVTGSAHGQSMHPSSAILVIEVSDSSLLFDRTRKAGLYAAAGIPEYWIVNLEDDQLEVLRAPAPDLQHPFGHRYSQVTTLPADQSIAPLASPQSWVAVADLLP